MQGGSRLCLNFLQYPAEKLSDLLNRLGFIIVRQRGSHVFMQRQDATVTVPMNDPVKKTTLKSILNQAGVSLEAFLENL
jgi:predicted RNA binding protein YcfA (HicA-like mRNA interferase family)